MSKLDNQPTTGERLDKTYETLMTVMDLAATVERACAGAIDLEGTSLKNSVGSIGRIARLLESLAGQAAEEVESCEEYQNAAKQNEGGHTLISRAEAA